MRLFTPGPVNLSRSAAEGLAAPTTHHRSKAFEELYSSLLAGLKSSFLTSGTVTVLTASGTGGMEAAVASLIKPSEKVLIPVSGKFSERWVEISEVYGIESIVIDLEPGLSPEPEDIKARLDEHLISGVFLTHCETSTGALTDLKSISEAIDDWSRMHGHRVLKIADCISTLCVDELRMEEWHLDCCIAASQKGLLAPPGLAFVALSDEAMRALAGANCKSYYLDLQRYVEAVPHYPFTPAVHAVRAAVASLESILAIGIEKLWKYYGNSASAIRILLSDAGFKPVASSQASAAVAFWSGGVDPITLGQTLERTHRILIAQGQGHLKGRIFRISPIGKTTAELQQLGVALAEALRQYGVDLTDEALVHYEQMLAREKVQW